MVVDLIVPCLCFPFLLLPFHCTPCSVTARTAVDSTAVRMLTVPQSKFGESRLEDFFKAEILPGYPPTPLRDFTECSNLASFLPAALGHASAIFCEPDAQTEALVAVLKDRRKPSTESSLVDTLIT